MKPLSQWNTDTTLPQWPLAVRISAILSMFLAVSVLSWAIYMAKQETPCTGRTIAIVIIWLFQGILTGIFAIIALNEVKHQLRQRWLPFDGKANDGAISGIMVEGDPKAKPMTWLNRLFVKFFWNKVAVLKVDQEALANRLGYGILKWRIGFKPEHGNAKLKVQVLTTDTVRVRIGRESCRFFALGLDEKEIPLNRIETTSIDDPRYANVPLQ